MSEWLLWSIIIGCAALLSGFLLSLGARKRYREKRKAFSALSTKKGVTGEELAIAALEVYSLNDTAIACASDPDLNAYSLKNTTLIYSEDVLSSSTVYSLAVVAHEVGHAIQHQKGSLSLALWHVLTIFERFTSPLLLPCFLTGLVLLIFPAMAVTSTILLNLATIFTICAVLNRLINIPNEKRASSFALEMLKNSQALDKQELKGAKKFLSAALGTYVLGAYERLFLNFYLIARAGKYTVRKIRNRKNDVSK